MTKKKFKGLICGILVIALLAGTAGLLVSIFNNDKTSIGSSAFDVGAIDAEGHHVKTEQSIYTPEMFECQGLAIEPEFDAKGSFQVFYYDFDKEFIKATEVFDASCDVYEKLSTEKLAKYARIVITPEMPLDENENPDEDYSLNIFDVRGIVSDYSITVNKDQDFVEALKGDAKNVYELATEGDDEEAVYVSENVATTENAHASYLLVKVRSSTIKDNKVSISMQTKNDMGELYDGTITNYNVLSDNGKVAYILFDLSRSVDRLGLNIMTLNVDYASRNVAEMYFIK